MNLKTRITGVLFCLLIYAGAVALDLYNSSRYKESVNLDGEHLYTNWFSVYGVPGLHRLDGLDVLSASLWPALLILPLLLFFLLKRNDVNRLNKSLIGIDAIFLFNPIYMTSGSRDRPLFLTMIGVVEHRYTSFTE